MTNRLPALGDKVRDRITGFEGIATTHAAHLTGCDRFWVTPPVGEDGKPVDGMWVDIDMLEITQPSAIERVEYTRHAPGGIDLPPSR
ncbi:hypothetical protein PZ897_02210 [Hoeflea sp. YIM 152468]|uniref:hypothetical protein n=1 Tax=Hoeflea sp. YIM 152468 TaxID=3031759 RepID=UPI0023DB2832|nr:hypothetical protein [Hoeflea sp. YIM 152468]MDF1606984.1 hypothetical protein [Hoeflea sp. YIM 152468]